MSILLAGLPDLLTVPVIKRLTEQGDEVRLVIPPGGDADRWRALGAHPAAGDLADDDFVWRAATNVRTIVLGEEFPNSALAPVLKGAAQAEVERIVVCAPQPEPSLPETLAPTPFEYVILTTARKPLVGRARTRLPISKLAEVIDAADDLSGKLRLELDLTVERSWQVLRVLPPE